MKIKQVMGFIGLGLLIFGLIVGLDLGKKVNQLLSEATGKKAEIVVDAQKSLGNMPRPWNNFGQGGETNEGMLTPVVLQMKELSPSYIRIDHIYDFYEVVNRDNGSLRFNFAKLDKEVGAILQMGAKPFFALSYMPPALAPGVTDKPDNWGEWQQLVRATIEHYSGKENMNIEGVYYEVWNEPDLFGGFKVWGDKNYLEMYRVSAQAAQEVKGVNEFKIGGPATTGLYNNWIEGLFKMVIEESLRLDFVSWHRYSFDPDSFKQDVEGLNNLMKKYPKLALKERIITEWGPDPENHPSYDNQVGAAHAVASIREMLGRINKAIVFEIKDGLSPEGKVFWGRFGIITHESKGLSLKPRYNAFKWLNQVGETRLLMSGEGSWVRGMAAKRGEIIQVNLVNYDKFSQHREAVPVVVKNLALGRYIVVEEDFDGKTTQTEVSINKGTWSGKVIMRPNEIVRLELRPI